MLAFYLAAMEDEGERRRFPELYARYFPGDRASAEDAVHNAFLQVIRHFPKFPKSPAAEFPSGSFLL